MNCNQAQTKMAKLIDFELSNGSVVELSDHIHSCSACEQHYNEVKAAFSKGLGMPILSDSFEAKLKQKIERLNASKNTAQKGDGNIYKLPSIKQKKWQHRYVNNQSIGASITAVAVLAGLFLYGDLNNKQTPLANRQNDEVTQDLLNLNLDKFDKTFIEHTQLKIPHNTTAYFSVKEGQVCDKDFLIL
ncbi:MAG: hypothetical protein ACJAVV_000807 [Alphaproteobacteria bacterium]|jgi:hypothetical protein